MISPIAPFTEISKEEAVWRSAVQFGDRLTVVTRNSVYMLVALSDGRFIISGGWFERENAGPSVVYVAGCTYGGSAINHKIVAAPRLRLELGNGLVTTEIQHVIFERFADPAVN